jgi:hypothetical protein
MVNLSAPLLNIWRLTRHGNCYHDSPCAFPLPCTHAGRVQVAWASADDANQRQIAKDEKRIPVFSPSLEGLASDEAMARQRDRTAVGELLLATAATFPTAGYGQGTARLLTALYRLNGGSAAHAYAAVVQLMTVPAAGLELLMPATPQVSSTRTCARVSPQYCHAAAG